MISVNGLTKVYRGNKREVVVDNVSFECRSGEVLGIIGPNSAGKTTLLRMLSTLMPPTSGDAVGSVLELCNFTGASRLEDAYRANMQADMLERVAL